MQAISVAKKTHPSDLYMATSKSDHIKELMLTIVFIFFLKYTVCSSSFFL